MKPLRTLDRMTVWQAGVEREGRFGVERDVKLAQTIEVTHRLLNAAQHGVDLAVRELDPHKF